MVPGLWCRVGGIRRTAVPSEPTESVIATFAESETELTLGATKRKRKRRRSPGGLGRGLARILTDTQAGSHVSDTGHSGLLQLVGGQSNAKADRIRGFVVDTALTTMAEAFSLDGVVLAAQGPPQPSGGDGGANEAARDLDEPQHAGPVSDGFDDSRHAAPGRQFADGADGTDGSEHDSEAEAVPTFLAARLPPSWAAESQVLFEIYGNLWRVLQHDFHEVGSSLLGGRLPSPVPLQEQWQIPIGRHWILISRMDDGGVPVAAVAIRKASFSPAEADAFGAVVGSVVAACSENDSKSGARALIGAGTSASLKSEGADVLAEVNADWTLGPDHPTPAGRRIGVGRGPDPVTAVARAAAKACRPRCEITFAGSSELEDVEVSIVMIRHATQGLRLGYAVREKGDYSGVAEAVFTAAG